MSIKLDSVSLCDCHNYMPNVENEFVDLILIDPPYNELDQEWDDFDDWQWISNEFNRVLKQNGQIYIFGKQPMLSEVYYIMKQTFVFRFEIVWNKGRGTWASEYQPFRSHELVWCFKKKGVRNEDLYYDINSIKTQGKPYFRTKNNPKNIAHRNWEQRSTLNEDGKRYPLSVFDCPAVRSDTTDFKEKHPTQKPLELLRFIIRSSCPKYGVVLDCFAGSGTTFLAAREWSRHFIGCEKYQKFYKLCKKNLAQRVLM